MSLLLFLSLLDNFVANVAMQIRLLSPFDPICDIVTIVMISTAHQSCVSKTRPWQNEPHVLDGRFGIPSDEWLGKKPQSEVFGRRVANSERFRPGYFIIFKSVGHHKIVHSPVDKLLRLLLLLMIIRGKHRFNSWWGWGQLELSQLSSFQEMELWFQPTFKIFMNTQAYDRFFYFLCPYHHPHHPSLIS